MYKILLADDVKLTLATEKEFLEGRNLKVFAAASADEAREMAGVVQPDLVVLDYEMPGMTGAEVCHHLKNNPETAHIPVLIMSIRDDAEILRQCETAGAAGFLRKAEGREALLARVASTLGVPRRRHVRVPCQFTVGINDNDNRVFSGEVENVSESGMFLTTERKFSTGMALRLRFTLPPSQSDIRLLGEVVRAEEIADNTHGFGIQFLEMDPASRDALQHFLDKSL